MFFFKICALYRFKRLLSSDYRHSRIVGARARRPSECFCFVSFFFAHFHIDPPRCLRCRHLRRSFSSLLAFRLRFFFPTFFFSHRFPPQKSPGTPCFYRPTENPVGPSLVPASAVLSPFFTSIPKILLDPLFSRPGSVRALLPDYPPPETPLSVIFVFISPPGFCVSPPPDGFQNLLGKFRIGVLRDAPQFLLPAFFVIEG